MILSRLLPWLAKRSLVFSYNNEKWLFSYYFNVYWSNIWREQKRPVEVERRFPHNHSLWPSIHLCSVLKYTEIPLEKWEAVRGQKQTHTHILSSICSKEAEQSDYPPILPPLFPFLRNYLCWNIPSHICTYGQIPGEEMEEREEIRVTKDLIWSINNYGSWKAYESKGPC